MCRVRHAGVEWSLVIVTDDGGVGRIEFRLELLADRVGHQVRRPVWRDLPGSCATERRTKVFRAHRPATHRHDVVLRVLSTDEEGHTLAMHQHRIVDAGFEDVEATRPNLGRGHRLQFVFFGLWQPIEVVVCASNGLTCLASKPVVKADLAGWVHRVLNHQADRLSGGRVELHAVHGVRGKHQRGVAVERQADGVVARVGEHRTVDHAYGLDMEDHTARSTFHRRLEGDVVLTKRRVRRHGQHHRLTDWVAVVGHVLTEDAEVEFTTEGVELAALEVNLSGKTEVVPTSNPIQGVQFSPGLVKDAQAVELNVVLDANVETGGGPIADLLSDWVDHRDVGFHGGFIVP